MTGKLAILAGGGALPQTLAAEFPDALFVTFHKDTPTPDNGTMLRARFELFGELFSDLRRAGVTEIVMAGSMARPDPDPAQFDTETITIFPRLVEAMAGGDDGLLREVISIFEEQGFAVRGAHELLPTLVAEAGLLAGPQPGQADLDDAARAKAILTALAKHDIGQAAVVAGGLCLGIETLQGTDALLRYVATTPDKLRRGAGVLVKMPKDGQDLRVDMPAIGPETVVAASDAKLAGIVIKAGQVLIMDRDTTLKAAEQAGLFLLAE